MHDNLLINPFGKAELIHTSGRASNASDGQFLRSTRQTSDGLFRITCNADGTINVHRYEGRRATEYVLNVVCENEVIQRLAIDKTQVRILHNYWLSSDGLTQRRIDDELLDNVEAIEEELGTRPKLELALGEQHELQRVDVRFANQWVTMMFYKRTLVNVRMNGNFFGQQLWFLCADARRRQIDFSRGFRRIEDNDEDLTNSEESEEEVLARHRPIVRQGSARTSGRSQQSTTPAKSGPPPIEERENPDVVRTPLLQRQLVAGMSGTARVMAAARPASRIGAMYTLGPYTPPGRIDLPLTMPLPSQSLSQNVPRAIPTSEIPIEMDVTPSTPSAAMASPNNTSDVQATRNVESVGLAQCVETEEPTQSIENAGNEQNVLPARDEEELPKKSTKSKLSAKSIQRVFLQAIASLKFESDDSD